MTVEGKKIKHCHGKEAGKTLMTLKSHAQAVRVHKAIMYKKHKKKKKVGKAKRT